MRYVREKIVQRSRPVATKLDNPSATPAVTLSEWSLAAGPLLDESKDGQQKKKQ
jgi:hypothetical protein